MTFSLPDRWVWDFWIAQDSGRFHLFYLNAPRSLGDPDLRHRNATIGHAVSDDLSTWSDLGAVLAPGVAGGFDETATWTGCTLFDGARWRLFYTGSRFLDPVRHVNRETVGAAVSDDLHEWSKLEGPLVEADPRWYEVLADGTWHEEAWRDPWVFAADGRWHMLVTARAKGDGSRDTGVIGWATSDDLERWQVQPPLSDAGSGFAHLEVPQVVPTERGEVLVFSCDSTHLAGARSGGDGGVWIAARDGATGRFDIRGARLLSDEALYAGRLVRGLDGAWLLMGFQGLQGDGFDGTVSDPVPLVWEGDGVLGMRIASPERPVDAEVVR